MQFRFYFLILTLFSCLEISGQEISDWHNKYLKGKISQEQISLLAQRNYYMAEGLNAFITDNKENKQRLSQVKDALIKLAAQIKASDKGQIKSAFAKITKELNLKINKLNDPWKIYDAMFNNLQTMYSNFYIALKNKEITVGADKGKTLPKQLNFPDNDSLTKYFYAQKKEILKGAIKVKHFPAKKKKKGEKK